MKLNFNTRSSNQLFVDYNKLIPPECNNSRHRRETTTYISSYKTFKTKLK